jgi:hypothetical protein
MTKVDLEASLNALDKRLIFFGVLVAIGVVGESIYGFLHWRKSNELQDLQNLENLGLQKEIAQLTKQAEEDHLARVKIEQKMAPRSFDEHQQKQLAEKIKTFSGQRIDIFVIGNSLEIHNFSQKIISGLKEGNWVPLVWSPIGNSVAAQGIVLSMRDNADDNVERALKELLSGLTATGTSAGQTKPFSGTEIPFGGVMGPDWDKGKIAPIRMYIGGKP